MSAATARFRCFSSVGTLPVAAVAISAMGALAAAVLLEVGALAVVAAVLLAMSVFLASAKTQVVVGRDGVGIQWLHRRRFIPFGSIAWITTANQGVGQQDTTLVNVVETQVLIRLHDGEVVSLTTASVRVPTMERALVDAADVDEPTRRELVQAVRAGLAAARPAEATLLDDALAPRAGADEWIAALRQLGAQVNAGGYRAAELPPETLWRVVEDPTAPPYARAGAALALRATLDDEGRARVLRVTEETASPKLRVALEAVAAEGDEAELVDVFAPLVEERKR